MKEELKIPVETLRANFLSRVECWEPETAFETMMSGWIKHPRFKSPTRQTISQRERTDGFRWLKADEIFSLEAYCGTELL